MEAVVVTAWPTQNGVTTGVGPALEGCCSGYCRAVVLTGRLVHCPSVEGSAADHSSGLEHWAWNGTTPAVVGWGAQAAVVVVIVGY